MHFTVTATMYLTDFDPFVFTKYMEEEKTFSANDMKRAIMTVGENNVGVYCKQTNVCKLDDVKSQAQRAILYLKFMQRF